MTAPRDDRVFLAHIRDALSRVESYVHGVSEAEFRRQPILQDAVIRQVQIAGEAARHLSPAFLEAHPEVPWSAIIGMRHKLVHDYFRVSLDRVWVAATSEVPPLNAKIQRMLDAHA